MSGASGVKECVKMHAHLVKSFGNVFRLSFFFSFILPLQFSFQFHSLLSASQKHYMEYYCEFSGNLGARGFVFFFSFLFFF